MLMYTILSVEQGQREQDEERTTNRPNNNGYIAKKRDTHTLIYDTRQSTIQQYLTAKFVRSRA